MKSYWQQIVQRRLSRRRAIMGASAAAASAAFLAACGGDDDDDSGGAPGGTAGTGLLARPEESSAKAGGTLKHYHGSDIDHFDATISATSQTVALSSEPFYPRMLGLETAKYPKEPDGSSRGELAEKWEVSGDRLTITFKIRPGMKWDARAPTNNRIIDADDVMFSFDKFQKLNNASLSLSANIESMTAPDKQTIVVKMSSPDASIIPLFSGRDLLYVEPKEADGGFDARKDVRGHGPWLLQEYVPSSHFTYVRNPDYYLSGKPYPERVDVPIITEHATRLAQFRAGNIHTDVLANVQEDIIQTKRDLPRTLLVEGGTFNPSSTLLLTFGWEPGARWHDKRARQALSMMIDREAFIDVIFNRDRFAQDGIEIQSRLNSVVPGGWTEYWLDPADQAKFGQEAKYLKYDVAEAKKLLSAAGAEGFEFDLYYNGGPQFGAAYAKTAELYHGFFSAGGLRPRQAPVTPFDTWLSHYSRRYTIAFGGYDANPGHTGVSLIAERTYSTLPVQVRNQMHKDGQGYRGMVPPGGSVATGDPKSNDLALRIGREFDKNKQTDLVHELTRYVTDEMYYVPRVAAEKGLTLWWPAVGNAGVDVAYPNSNFWADQRQNWWVDPSKAPFV